MVANSDLQFYPDPWEDPESRTPSSGLQNSYGVDYRTLRGIYFLDPPRGLGMEAGGRPPVERPGPGVHRPAVCRGAVGRWEG